MRVDFTVTRTSVSDARLAANIAYARSLGLPAVADRAGGKALNVIGRGPSIIHHLGALRHDDDADNWAAGTAWAWCRANGIDAVLVAADPSARMAEARYVCGVSHAIVAEHCDPTLFDVLLAADAKVEIAGGEWIACGSTAAIMAAIIGVTIENPTRLYGCEGSYGATTHADEDIPQPNGMLIRCNGAAFRTNPQMLIQSEELSRIVRLCPPHLFRDCSGGLLGALIASGGDWELLDWPHAPANVRGLMDRADGMRARDFRSAAE